LTSFDPKTINDQRLKGVKFLPSSSLFKYRSTTRKHQVLTEIYKQQLLIIQMCTLNNFEELEQIEDDLYVSRDGFWSPNSISILYEYLDSSDLHFKFAKVR